METKTYTYGDSSWGDLLTKYNGKTVGHDAIGNMTSYNGASYSWQGRELTKVTSGSNTYSYKYDADGIRTSKTVNGTKTEFFLNGSQILAQKTGDTTMLFFYDSTGKRVGFANGDTLYYYLYNVQGDVIAIIKDIQAFIQPCTESYNKNVWDNCALIISKRSDAELLPYLDKLFAWLQDMNWPGAFCILDRLRKYAKTPSYDSVLNACFEKAKAENDYVWWNNLQMLKGESCLNLSNQ